MKQLYFVMFLVLPFVLSGPALAQDPTIDGAYTLVGKQKVNRVLYDFTYQVNIINDDTAIQNVSATVSSSSANTVIIDNRVDFNDLAIEETSTSIDTFTLRQDRRHPFDPGVLNWEINFELDVPAPNINVSTSPSEQTFILGEFQNIATSVNFTPPASGNSFTITIEQAVTPNSGLNLSPNVNGTTFNPSADFATTLNQEISPSLVGEYEITTTATIMETGESATSTAKVIIVSGEQASLIINTPGTENGALLPNATTDAVFTVQVHGIELDEILNVNLNGINNSSSLFLNDNGQDGDLVADDGAYSGTLVVNTDGFLPQQCLTYEAVATTNSESFTSLPYDLCVTEFPIGFQPSDSSESNLIPDPETGDPAIADEVLIGFKADVSESTIISIVSSINGQVVGSLVELGVYQVKLDSPVSSSSELTTIISTLVALPEVEFAEANGIDQGTTIVPTDSKFIDQNGIKKIRADEAWYIARGNVTIAIVDSGADLTHPDLNAKIIKGTDFVNGGDPDDENGHGTHVAGIAAAETNNSTGIAGVSWGSKALIVRVLDNNNKGPYTRTAQGIKYAADNGARIINTSFGGTGGKSIKCAAATYAIGKGSLVIASAGNNGNSTKSYPAACPGVIAVGNTTSSDGRASSSNFGSWVDLAAPGTQILSTVPITGSCTHCTASGYKRLTGTSMASPMVAGAAAVLLSREPSLTNSKIEERLKKTAKKLPGLNLGAGRIDLFEAVFNGSFEEGNLALWQKSGTVASFDKLGPLNPQDRKRMGYVSTGPAAAQAAGSLTQSFTVQTGVTTLPITFTYAFISEEFPEFVGTEFNDSLKVSLRAPNGTITELATETINSSSYTAISGLDFPGGDDTVGWTGWKTVTKEVPVTAGAGEYQIILEDAGDAIYDTVLLIDHIQFKK